MAWRRIKSNAKFVKWEEAGQIIEGRFIGIHDGTYGPLATVQTEDGDVQFPVTTALACLNDGVREGQMIRIEYLGVETSKAGREFKTFSVDVLDEDTTTPKTEQGPR